MPRVILPCCYFPTTTVLVDDSETMLEDLAMSLSDYNILTKPFTDPLEAQAFIKKAKVFDIDEVCNTTVEMADARSVFETKTDLSCIVQQADNRKNCETISTLVTDYNMPHPNGIELCRMTNPILKKMILTGAGDNALAVSAFNDGVIDQFIMKGESGLIDKLASLIKALQFDFFAQQSPQIYKLYVDRYSSKPFLHDPGVVNWFKQFLQNNHYSEFYLATNEGYIDFILIDRANNVKSWLALRDEADLESLYFTAESFDADKEILNPIKKQEAIPVFSSDKQAELSPNDWSQIFTKLEDIPGSNTKAFFAHKKKI